MKHRKRGLEGRIAKWQNLCLACVRSRVPFQYGANKRPLGKQGPRGHGTEAQGGRQWKDINEVQKVREKAKKEECAILLKLAQNLIGD